MSRRQKTQYTMPHGTRACSRLGRTVWLALAALPLTATAAGQDPDPWRIWAGLGAESFLWDEFVDGEREVRESGVRFNGELGLDNAAFLAPGAQYALRSRWTYGRVDYDGTAQWLDENDNRVTAPARSNSDYTGFNMVASGGYRWELTPAHSVVATAGMELDSWSRNIRDTSDVDFETEPENFDGTVSGYVERYFLFASRAAAGMGHRLGNWELDWRAGVRYPFFVDEYVAITNVALKPEGEVSPMARMEIRHANSPFSLLLHYETYRFDDSDEVPIPGSEHLVKQPRSVSSRVGMSVRYRLR